VASTELELYQNLMNLCGEPDSPFFYKDFEFDGYTYRIFNYRLASYTDFLKPDALWARGIMFNMYEGQMDQLVCRPMPKFFNMDENPLTMNLDHRKLVSIMSKEDGSLISTFIHYAEVDGEEKPFLSLKSKGSLDSDQAKMAKAVLRDPEMNYFMLRLRDATLDGWTVNMELTSPDNRIVLPYQKTQLKILNAVFLPTGEVIYRDGCEDTALELLDEEYWVEEHYVNPGEEEEFIKKVDSQTGIEGYVFRYPDQLVKKKTTWYLTLHATKDSITIPRRLFECVINEATDDLKSMFATDPAALAAIKDMEEKVIPKFNHICSIPDKFYKENAHLSRKDYAIKGQAELGEFFSLAMNRYLLENKIQAKPIDLKEWAIKNYKMFGIKEELPDDAIAVE